MGARDKLNQAYITGSLIMAAVAGLITGSFVVFVVTFTVLLVLNLVGGEIR